MTSTRAVQLTMTCVGILSLCGTTIPTKDRRKLVAQPADQGLAEARVGPALTREPTSPEYGLRQRLFCTASSLRNSNLGAGGNVARNTIESI